MHMKARHTYSVFVLGCSLLVLARADDAAHAARFQWPASNHYNRVIVNAQQGVESYPKEWFSRDFLVTDLTIANVRMLASGSEQYRDLRDLLTSYGLAVGTYISGTTVEPL